MENCPLIDGNIPIIGATECPSRHGHILPQSYIRLLSRSSRLSTSTHGCWSTKVLNFVLEKTHIDLRSLRPSTGGALCTKTFQASRRCEFLCRSIVTTPLVYSGSGGCSSKLHNKHQLPLLDASFCSIRTQLTILALNSERTESVRSFFPFDSSMLT